MAMTNKNVISYLWYSSKSVRSQFWTILRNGGRHVKLIFVVGVSLAVTIMVLWVSLKQRDTLVTVVANTEYLEGVLHGRPQAQNEWVADGAILCIEAENDRADVMRALTQVIRDIRVLNVDTPLGDFEACTGEHYLRVELPSSGMRVRANAGTILSFERVAQGPLILELAQGSMGSNGVGTVGYEGDDGASLGKYVILVFNRLSERASRGEPVIFPLRLREAVIGSVARSGEARLLVSGDAFLREMSSWSSERYLTGETQLDPGDEVRIQPDAEESSFAEGFVRMSGDSDNPGGVEVVLHQGNAMVQVTRRGASAFGIAPSWTARFVHDPFLGAAIIALGLFNVLLVTCWHMFDAFRRGR